MQYDYKQIFNSSSLMVIVPHEDDEINLAGAVIRGAVESGIEVSCVFLTNGDWFYPPEIRLNEAIQALTVLGAQEEHIVFLGYRDGGVHAERSSYKCMNIHKAGRCCPALCVEGNRNLYLLFP